MTQSLKHRRFRFTYRTETYLIEVLSDDRLRWTREAGDDIGKTDEESYVASFPRDGQELLTWVEADGLGLSNLLDWDAGTVTTHAKVGRDVFENPGKLTPAS